MEKIKERIRKLMQLAGNNPSEAEREAAMRKAHQLLIEHHLTPLDVIDIPESVNAYADGVAFKNLPWRRIVMNGIAQLYFCKLITVKEGQKFRATFVGMRVDAEVAQIVSAAVIETLHTQGRIYEAANPGSSNVSFKNGAVRTIYARCMDMIRGAQSEKVPGTALVVQNLYKTRLAESSDFIDKTWGKLKSAGRGISTKFDQAALDGAEFGRKVPLTKTIT